MIRHLELSAREFVDSINKAFGSEGTRSRILLAEVLLRLERIEQRMLGEVIEKEFVEAMEIWNSPDISIDAKINVMHKMSGRIKQLEIKRRLN